MERISSNKRPINPEETTRLLYKNWRERFALPLLIGVLVFGAIVLVPAVGASTSLIVDAIFITAYIITGLVTVIRFSYTVRMSVFLFAVYVLGLGELLTHGVLGDSLIFFFALIVFSTILLSPRAGIVVTAANILTFALFAFLFLSGQLTPLNPFASPAKLEDWFSATGVIVMFGVVVILGFQRLEKEFIEAQRQIDSTLNTLTEERRNLEIKVAERTQQLRQINEIGRHVAGILNPDELLPRAANIIENEFKFYYIAFFLVDLSGQWAELKEATGEAGRVLRENKYRLDINGKNPVAVAIRAKEGQISLDGGSEQMRVDNPLLPYTRSQIALPLIVGESVLGALEIHSTKENAFQPADINTFQNMANEIAIALENSRLFREAQQSLSEMQATQRQYLQGAWQSLTEEKDLVYALGDNDISNGNEIDIPLTLREQIIGQLHLANTVEWTAEQKNLVEAIATQAALALENARLVEESQSIAAREKLANEVISKVWASANMEGILQTAVRELGRSLEASEVEIEISMDGGDSE
ncbi:MAG: GAF domain-containing protein [Chloroflexi bacterium]|nr:GAF domain-containing protein [Chloroflexota bacterium]